MIYVNKADDVVTSIDYNNYIYPNREHYFCSTKQKYMKKRTTDCFLLGSIIYSNPGVLTNQDILLLAS